MLRLYRELKPGEFFVVGGDCSQGGADDNWAQFISKDRGDVPLVLQMSGVAADMTPVLHQALEYVFDITGVQPIVGLERNMGGASEMERLNKINRQNKYRLYYHKDISGSSNEKRLGFVTDIATRPRLVGDLKVAVDNQAIRIYDEETISQLGTFIVNKRSGKPEAASSTHDDAVMSLGVGWQLYQTETKIDLSYSNNNETTGDLGALWN